MRSWIIFVWICFLSYASGASVAMEDNDEPTNREWKTCSYDKKYIEGTLLETILQKNYKSCRRRCIEAESCNYWSFAHKKNPDVALRGTCFLYSAIDTNLTKKDSGRFSGDLSCSNAQSAKVALFPNWKF